jgi:hypothetical protein
MFLIAARSHDAGSSIARKTGLLFRARVMRGAILRHRFLWQLALVTLVYEPHARADVIFFLTSLFIDSIHSISRNNRSLHSKSMKNGKGE